MTATLQMGPQLMTTAPDFSAFNHDNRLLSLGDLMGAHGLVLGFTSDIWEPASVRRVMWFQRHFTQFSRLDIQLALLICNESHVLNGFALSSAVPLDFPLLSDSDQAVHRQYNMEGHAGLLVLDNACVIRDKWIMPEERVWPKAPELMGVLEAL